MLYELTGKALYPFSELLTMAEFPLAEYIPQESLDSVFGRLFYTDAQTYTTTGGYHLILRLAFEDELAFSLPGLPEIALVVGAAGSGWTSVEVELLIGPEPFAALNDVPLTLRLNRSMLKPMLSRTEVDASKPGVDVSLGTVSLVVNAAGFMADVDISASIPLAMIGDTGVLIEAANVRPILSPQDSMPVGLDASFRGIFIESARIYLPEGLPELAPSDLTITNCSIGTGGFSGGLSLGYNPVFDPQSLTFSGHGSGSLFGMQFGVQSVALSFKQNTLEAGSVAGSMVLSYFDAPLDVTIGLALDGGLTVALASANGLITLDKPGLFSLTLESIRFALDQGVFSVAISGEITPDVGALEWPTFRVEELSIDSQGSVRLEGGWLDLREQYVLSFYGFQLEITKIGFGSTDDGQRWIGFSGGLKLVEGLTAGASVEGMRILWDPRTNATALTLEGVGVELDIPDVLYFKGGISMTQPALGVFRFDGNITLELRSLGFSLEAQLVIGYDSNAGYTFFAIYLGVELPAGIPLAQTSLAIYGMAGLFALNMEPGRLAPPVLAEEEPWYAIQPEDSWYHRDPPGVGVYHLGKWKSEAGSLALGAGITLGTLADNGLTFNGRFLLVLILPGPIIMLEGRANILKERASLRDEPLFRSLAVIDGREGTFLVGLDAQYRYDESGSLIEIGGGAEAFFDFNRPEAWHLYLGIAEPRDRRIRAEIFERLFEANGYFMIDSSGLRTGAWVGYDKAWDFGPLHVSLEAWLEGAADLSFKPLYFNGSLWLHGSIEAKVFGFGFGLSADARIAAGVSDPFHIVAELSISLDLPWPFKDVSKTIMLEWGPDPIAPPLPVPLQEVAIEHFKVTTSWPLPATGATKLLLPTPDADNDGFWKGESLDPLSDGFFPAHAPVVPLDARPHITFGRVIHDLAGLGVNSSPVHPDNSGWEWIGDRTRNEGPARLKLSLLEVALQRRTNGVWQTLAAQAAPGQGTNVGRMFGSWAPTPHLPGGNPARGTPASPANTKLWLWSRSPFDYTQRTGGEWEEWFTQQYPDYPCVLIPADQEVCCDFAGLATGRAPAAPWSCSQQPQLVFGWRTQPAPVVADVLASAGKVVRGLCFAAGSEAFVFFGHEIKQARISVVQATATEDGKKLDCVEFDDLRDGPIANPVQQAGITFVGQDRNGNRLPRLNVATVHHSNNTGARRGLTRWWELHIHLPGSVSLVEVMVSTQAQPIEAEAFDSRGTSLGSVRQQSGQNRFETLRLEAPIDSQGIASVLLQAPGEEAYLHGMCYRIDPSFGVFADALDASRGLLKRYRAKDGEIEIDGKGVRGVLVRAQGGSFCLTKVCVVEGLDDEERIEREEMLRSVTEGLAHWESDGEVLPAWSQLRLKIVTSLRVQTYAPLNQSDTSHSITQFAYFRTEGPPALTRLTLPAGHPLSSQASTGGTDAPAFDSGVDDLTRYVAQTVPPTVPNQPGEKPHLPRPVYCAYDIGVKFNEDYVEQMYATVGRDLSLYLFDNNDHPARDAYGRLLTPTNRWGRQAALSLSRSEERWLRHLNATTCATIDLRKIARDQDLQSSGQVLAADTLYEARLIPLLLHETFAGYPPGMVTTAQAPLSGGPAGGWLVVDDGTPTSRWVVGEEGNPPSRYIEQQAAVFRGSAARSSAFPGGAFLLPGTHTRLDIAAPDQPGNWKNYRASAYVRSPGDNPVGLAVRWNNGIGYLFYLDRSLNRRRLVRVDTSRAVVLAKIPGGYQPGLESHIAIEAIDDWLRVFVNGEQVCEVQDATYTDGRIALFACNSPGATFHDVRVDDLRANAPVVYAFKFTTSRFSDFIHHIHSFRNLVFTASLPDLNAVQAAVATAVDTAGLAATTAPANAEVTAYEALATKAVGAASHQQTDGFDVTRIEHNGQAIGLLIRTGEPIDWRRTTLKLSQAAEQQLLPEPPNGPRSIAVSFASGAPPTPLTESVLLLLTDATNLTGWRVERRVLPDPVTNLDPQWQPWYTFDAEPLRAAGQRVRIYAGQGTSAPPSAAGEDLRFGLAPVTGFQPSFPTAGVDLRIVRPDGRSAHIRRFLPDSAYSATTATMLRAADGTGVILLRPNAAAPGSQLNAAEYRLRWEYRRNNTALESASLVLSRNGDTSPEIAQFDIPWRIPEQG